jgi:hypothetical protein
VTVERIRVQNTSRCDNCHRPAGTRMRLGDESGPVRIAFCPNCDLPTELKNPATLPVGILAALQHRTWGTQ